MTNVVILLLHNFLRWVILALFLVVLFRSFAGWRGKRAWVAIDRMLTLVLTVAMDIQMVLGLVLYLFRGFAALETYIVMEHIPPMLLAVVLAHVGSAKAKKAGQDSEKFRWTAIWFSIAFLLILVTIPWVRPLMHLF